MRFAIYTRNTPTILRIDQALATEIGLDESMLLLALDHWTQSSGILMDGRYWLKTSIRDIHTTLLPFWSVPKTARVLKRLIQRNLVLTAPGHYALNYDICRSLSSIAILPVSDTPTTPSPTLPPPPDDTPVDIWTTVQQHQLSAPSTPLYSILPPHLWLDAVGITDPARRMILSKSLPTDIIVGWLLFALAQSWARNPIAIAIKAIQRHDTLPPPFQRLAHLSLHDWYTFSNHPADAQSHPAFAAWRSIYFNRNGHSAPVPWGLDQWPNLDQ